MKKTTLLIALVFLSMLRMLAQSNTVSAGMEATGSGGSASSSFGEVFFQYKASDVGNIKEGVQQSYTSNPTGFISGNAAICAGASAQLSLALTGQGPWFGTLSDGTPFSGGDNPLMVTVSPTENTTYTIATLSGETGTATTADLSGSATVTVNPLPVLPTISANGSTTLCEGNSVTLSIANAPVIAQTIPLDEVPGATLAVGLRKLRSSYTGAALRLRRSSDQAEQDFGFVGNNLDMNAISAWLDGAEGYCTTLYDQSGNGGHVTQTNDNQQPLFVSNGINNKPTLHFNSSQYMNNDVSYQAPYSVIYGSRVTGQSERVLASKNNNWLLGYWSTNMDCAHFNNWVIEPSKPTITNQYNIYAAAVTGSISTIYKNGIQLASNGNSVTGPDGIQLNGSGIFWETSDCDFTDVIIHGSALSAGDITKLNNSIGMYYSSGTSSALSYQWSTGETTPSIAVSASGSYTATVTNASGCSATSEATVVTVNPLPTPIITGNRIICGDASITLDAGAGYASYHWATGQTTRTIEASAANAAGPFAVTVTNSAGCSAVSPTVTVGMASSPAIPVITGNTTICGGGSTTLTASSGSKISYLWSTGSYNQSISVQTAGTYWVTVTNTDGCSAISAAITVTVSALPATPTVSVIQPACNGLGNITITNSNTSNTYSLNGGDYINTAVFGQLVAGTYTITAKNAAGCISPVATVVLTASSGTAVAAPVLSVTQPTCASAYGTIRVTSTVFFNSFSINGSDFTNLTGVFSGLIPGNYLVRAKNASGCISEPTSITVNPQPVTPAAPKVNLTHPTCAVTTGTIEISTVEAGMTFSTNNFTYLNTTGIFTAVVSGSYNVTAKSAAGCISPATPVVINPRQTVPTTPSATVIQPTCTVATGTITVSSPSSANTYSITRNNVTIYSTNGSFSGLASGTYSLVAISSGGCLSTAKSVVVNAQPATPTAPTLSVTQPTATVATGTIKVTSMVFGNSFSIGVSGFTNLTGVFSGLATGWYNISAKNSAGCISLPSTVMVGSGLSRGPQTAPATETAAPVATAPTVAVSTVTEKATVTTPAALASDLFDVSAYPNPTSTDFRLSIYGAASETIKVTVYDVFGRAVKYFSFASKPSITMGQDLKAGVYMIEVRQGKNMKTLKLVKF